MTAFIVGLCAMAFAGIGSAVGIASAGKSAIGIEQLKASQGEAPPNLILYVLMPFSQTLYGLVVFAVAVFVVKDKFPPLGPKAWPFIVMGIATGMAIGASAMFQGFVGARACDCIGKQNAGKGTAIMIMGTVETIALFVMVMSIVGMFLAM